MSVGAWDVYVSLSENGSSLFAEGENESGSCIYVRIGVVCGSD